MSNRADGQSNNLTVREEALLNMQKLYLEALRSRESEVLQFIIILVSALGGFSWVIGKYISGGEQPQDPLIPAYAFTVLAVLLLLSLGAMHAMALSYNYRSILLQLRKIEQEMKVSNAILQAWRKKKCSYSLPEILKYFYTIYICGIILVSLVSFYALSSYYPFFSYVVLIVGAVSIFMLCCCMRFYYAKKINDICKKENNNNPG